MDINIEKLTPDRAIDAYNCQPDTPGLIEFKQQSAKFLAEKIREERWVAFALYHQEKPVGKAILIPTESGMIWIAGEGVYYFHCLNLQPAYRKKGWGRKFLNAIIDEMRDMDTRALAVTCFEEYWMSYSFFNHMGFEKIDSNGIASLLVKRFSDDARISLLPQKPQFPLQDDTVRVDIIYDLSCPFMTANYSSHKETAQSVSKHVRVFEHYIRMACDYSSVGDPGFYVEGEDITAGPVDKKLIVEKITLQLKKKNLD